MFEEKTLLITGGTGSFGNAALSRFLNTDIKEIRIFSRDEQKQDDMRVRIKSEKLKFYIGDVRDIASVNEVMKGVDYVFHAAALKQVPSCEFFPMQAVQTNIIGTENVLNSAINYGISKVIFLSTDKAVYPVNAMGLSKALAEKILGSKARALTNHDTIICGTRYGNVMGTRGSVIPLFVNQIKNGLPITITDPKMTRFMMTLEDAINLVLYAYEHGKQGDMFVQKAPDSEIGILAKALLSLYKADNKIIIIGTRHGEKLYETLVNREEMAKSQDLDQYFRIPTDTRDLNYTKYISEGEEDVSLLNDYTSHNTERLDIQAMKKLLLKLDWIRKDI